ncbi:hypothetical protein PFAG_04718 [Plasmodium falciparum Santa Lucia]|uniref:Uncharacterized protein n=6 Tax=Plasmodium falciparum TaxID=5833 RepID=W4J1P5_PLAFP|nr:hypothetical protein PFNF135_04827 [Plasmodium falciparum NF135/5.C10]ETW47428.1 hypothetical protein PFMALIP_04507 [Plasmodium falciparum MaliPS096_E11]ETW55532.1 hypothetical protein PFUGPA_02294 [Plasmodium falciparum Palo Alto/Uganda]ETW59435.1 hypothetical protein PFMC_04621 [Plasmodium falciparum CAMP/Malaysia]EUR65953.1 hypothetical protein PFBG_04693 [Plasmodium falciparum 7G8]EUT80077.1 hypothetical protein PFAG_04718 [Plasmodium falciparum Santa Lucia]
MKVIKKEQKKSIVSNNFDKDKNKDNSQNTKEYLIFIKYRILKEKKLNIL